MYFECSNYIYLAKARKLEISRGRENESKKILKNESSSCREDVKCSANMSNSVPCRTCNKGIKNKPYRDSTIMDIIGKTKAYLK